MFTIVEKLIYIDHKNLKKMKNVTFIKWLAAGRYMSNISKRARKKLEN